MSNEIINKIANSGLINIDLEDYYPKYDIVEFDIKPFLWQELALKEKDFRAALKDLDLEKYKGKGVAIICSADAIIQPWVYLLVATYLNPIAAFISVGSKQKVIENIYSEIIQNLDISAFQDARIIIKGCSNKPVPQSAYINLISRLQPIAKGIMYGEACSTVPLFKKR